ncbi:hypothetical protein ABFS82_11G103300 [Erythranthe guttata]
MASITATFFILFTLVSVSVMEMGESVGTNGESHGAIREEIKTKKCIRGLGICQSIDDCKIKCNISFLGLNQEGYCVRDPDVASECMCAYDC